LEAAAVGVRRPGCDQLGDKKLRPGSSVFSDGLSCFAVVVNTDCAHSHIVAGARTPAQMLKLRWFNTVLANLKTAIGGAHKACKFNKSERHYLGAFALVGKLLRAVSSAAPQ
jgi:hypothetical protein